ncbi:MAG: hotdog fold thioesterase [Deltaproteobacteria bacterium]|nr:hotdog fold thioesterase [Deltaproteobacteria bacterium]
MKPQNPDYRELAKALFDKAPFIAELGLQLSDLGPGWCETVLPVAPKHLQQDGYVHAGVQATVADHSAGGAAGTLVKADELVLTAEFKINLLRPAIADRLRCRSTVLKAGRTLIVAESEVFAVRDGKEKLTAKAIVTRNGQSQAVRLPKEFRFREDRVFVKKSGNVVLLIPVRGSWDSLVASLSKFSDDFLADREQPQAQRRGRLSR